MAFLSAIIVIYARQDLSFLMSHKQRPRIAFEVRHSLSRAHLILFVAENKRLGRLPHSLGLDDTHTKYAQQIVRGRTS